MLTAASIETREAELQRLFKEGDELVGKLKKQALTESLNDTSLRTISWRMFLGVLSTPPRFEQWRIDMAKHRAKYDTLRRQYCDLNPESRESDSNCSSIASSVPTGDDATFNNPLSLDSTSPWNQFFENEQLQKLILQDVERTYPENQFFCDEKVQKMMLNILFVYSKDHQDISYKQGMHELLAPLLFLFSQEKLKRQEGIALSEFMDEEFMEHDCFILFETIMKQAGEWFINTSPKQVQKGKDVITVPQDSPVLIKCRNIFLNLLKAKDPVLYTYINTLKIEPQVYLLRWVRLLFGREFRLEETLQVWDAIFSYDKTFSLVDYIAVAMLVSVREQLLATDYSGVLQTLFKFPCVLPTGTYINNALNMANPKRRKQQSQSPAVPHSPTSTANSHDGGATQGAKFYGTYGIGNVIGGVISGVIGAGKDAVSTLSQPSANSHGHHSTHSQTSENGNWNSKKVSEVEYQRSMQLFVASRLSNVIDTLQEGLFENQKIMPLLSDKVLLGVAELKQLKDILMGHIPPESLSGTPLTPSPTTPNPEPDQ